MHQMAWKEDHTLHPPGAQVAISAYKILYSGGASSEKTIKGNSVPVYLHLRRQHGSSWMTLPLKTELI